MTRKQGPRTRIAKGIYRDAYGLAATVKTRGRQREKRFPPDADLEELKAWRRTALGELLLETPAAPATAKTRRPARFARDVARFLKTRKGLPGYAADRSHLRAWVERFGTRDRSSITRQDIELTLAYWREHGQRRVGQKFARPLAAQTVKHRLRALRGLYLALDGHDADTPVDRVTRPKLARPIPQDVDIRTIRKVLPKLSAIDPAAGARARFLAATGLRPVELMRLAAADYDARRSLLTVRAAKDGLPRRLPLNADMKAAWRQLIELGALGEYDTTRQARLLRQAGWPAHVRPYNLRHAVAIAILRGGGDVGDVQAHLGHTSIETTRRFYAGVLEERVRSTSRRLEGRIPARKTG